MIGTGGASIVFDPIGLDLYELDYKATVRKVTTIRRVIKTAKTRRVIMASVSIPLADNGRGVNGMVNDRRHD